MGGFRLAALLGLGIFQLSHGAAPGVHEAGAAASEPELATGFKLQTLDGEDLLARAELHEPQGLRRLAEEVGAVHLEFVLHNETFNLDVPKAPSIFKAGALIHVAGEDGEVATLDAATFEVPAFRSAEASIIVDHGRVHAVVVDGDHTITVNREKDGAVALAHRASVVPGACGADGGGRRGLRGRSVGPGWNGESRHGPDDEASWRYRDAGKRLAEDWGQAHAHTSENHHDHEHEHDHDHEHDHEHDHRRLVELWTDCYTGDEAKRSLAIGVAMTSNLYGKLGSSVIAAATYLQALVSDSNTVYENQLNIVLTIGAVYLQTSHIRAPDWDQDESCAFDIHSQLMRWSRWTKPTPQGLWQLAGDCFQPGGFAGLAWIGTLCYPSFYNTGVTYDTGATTWTIFAHEIGHNFNAQHSFEEGVGTTGGIMDYGDGTLNGEYQFNRRYRFNEICSMIDRVVDTCPYLEVLPAVCGNGIVEPGEMCECGDGSDSCECCTLCQFPPEAECVPSVDGECCDSVTCQYLDRGFSCLVDDALGYCDQGTCRESSCRFISEFCGLEEDNECKQRCLIDDTCEEIEGLTNPDGTPADWAPGSCADGLGVCERGMCIRPPGDVSSAPSAKPSAGNPMSRMPSAEPSVSDAASSAPSAGPSVGPSAGNPMSPTLSAEPSVSGAVSGAPSAGPSVGIPFSTMPTAEPSVPDAVSSAPSVGPSVDIRMSTTPTAEPSTSDAVSSAPSAGPSVGIPLSTMPTAEPSVPDAASSAPSAGPSAGIAMSTMPTAEPSASDAASSAPSAGPSAGIQMSTTPTAEPSAFDAASSAPSAEPSVGIQMSTTPTAEPSVSDAVSSAPSAGPSASNPVSTTPTAEPSVSDAVSSAPSAEPSVDIRMSTTPTAEPSTSDAASSAPSARPSASNPVSTMPTAQPSASEAASSAPSAAQGMSMAPTAGVTRVPTWEPTVGFHTTTGEPTGGTVGSDSDVPSLVPTFGFGFRD